MGAVNCAVTLRDGGFLKLQLPKRGGLGGGMPRRAECREAILTRLRKLDVWYNFFCITIWSVV